MSFQIFAFIFLFGLAWGRPSEFVDRAFADGSVSDMDPGILGNGTSQSQEPMISGSTSDPIPTQKNDRTNEQSAGSNANAKENSLDEGWIAFLSILGLGGATGLGFVARLIYRAYLAGHLGGELADRVFDWFQVAAAVIRHPRIGGVPAITAA